ncbi:MAG: hypothetical protein EYC62_04835 [Alphaproteobacteria bacterium]|nr:MAG: hypothetical protein EYC62_04835 [Alphaproteobacteria bacterium]
MGTTIPKTIRFTDWAEQQLTTLADKYPAVKTLIGKPKDDRNYADLQQAAQEFSDRNIEQKEQAILGSLIAVIAAGELAERGELSRDALLEYITGILHNYFPEQQAKAHIATAASILQGLTIHAELDRAVQAIPRSTENDLGNWLLESCFRAIASAAAAQPNKQQQVAMLRAQYEAGIARLAAHQARAHFLTTQIATAEQALGGFKKQAAAAKEAKARALAAAAASEQQRQIQAAAAKAAEQKADQEAQQKAARHMALCEPLLEQILAARASGEIGAIEIPGANLQKKMNEIGVRSQFSDGELIIVHLTGKELKPFQAKFAAMMIEKLSGYTDDERSAIVRALGHREEIFSKAEKAALVFAGNFLATSVYFPGMPSDVLQDQTGLRGQLNDVATYAIRHFKIDEKTITTKFDQEKGLVTSNKDGSHPSPELSVLAEAANIYFHLFCSARVDVATAPFDKAWTEKTAKLTARQIFFLESRYESMNRRTSVNEALCIAGAFGLIPKIPPGKNFYKTISLHGFPCPVTWTTRDEKPPTPGQQCFIAAFQAESDKLRGEQAKEIGLAHALKSHFHELMPLVSGQPEKDAIMELAAQRYELAALREIVFKANQCDRLGLAYTSNDGSLAGDLKFSVSGFHLKNWKPFLQAFDALFQLNPNVALVWLSDLCGYRYQWMVKTEIPQLVKPAAAPFAMDMDFAMAELPAILARDSEADLIAHTAQYYTAFLHQGSLVCRYVNAIRSLQRCGGDIELLPDLMRQCGIASAHDGGELEHRIAALKTRNPATLAECYRQIIQGVCASICHDMAHDPFSMQTMVADIFGNETKIIPLLPHQLLPQITGGIGRISKDPPAGTSLILTLGKIIVAMCQNTPFGFAASAATELIGMIEQRVPNPSHPLGPGLRLLDIADRLCGQMLGSAFDYIDHPQNAAIRARIEEAQKAAQEIARLGTESPEAASIMQQFGLKIVRLNTEKVSFTNLKTGTNEINPIQQILIDSLDYYLRQKRTFEARELGPVSHAKLPERLSLVGTAGTLTKGARS